MPTNAHEFRTAAIKTARHPLGVEKRREAEVNRALDSLSISEYQYLK